MVIPNLPTDSLYKFCFVGGLLMIFLPYYTLVTKVENYNELSYEIDVEQVKLEIEMKSLRESYDMLTPLFQGIKDPQQEEYVILKSDELDKRYDILKSQEVELKMLEELFNEESNRIINFKKFTYILLFLGFIITFLSGWKWYTKIQKYEDFILEMKYNDLKSNK